jgi:hypothetical protein
MLLLFCVGMKFCPQLRGRTRIEGAGKEDAEEKIYW